MQVLSIEKYFIEFVKKTQLPQIDKLISALLLNKLSAYKSLAVMIAEQAFKQML